jgi:hypothetical protein
VNLLCGIAGLFVGAMLGASIATEMNAVFDHGQMFVRSPDGTGFDVSCPGGIPTVFYHFDPLAIIH